MKAKVHAIAGVVGFLTIATFWSSTLVTELMGSAGAITSVKNGILWGMIVLIPAMAIAGGSGMSLGQGRNDSEVLTKKKRMPIIALNGLLVLLPSAVFLASKANAGTFDGVFYAVQGLELIAGATNLSLMGLNIRDGLRLTGKIAAPGAGVANDVASIELRENGPAIAFGVKEFVGANGVAIPAKATMALCRCGATNNKPFCDGSHSNIEFSDDKSPQRTADEILSYEGREVTILYNRLLCSKASECGQRLGRVFDTTRNPWIDPDKGNVEEIVEVVRACPSGALRHRINGKSSRHETNSGARLTIEKDGPCHVRNISLTNGDWASGACEKKYSLCRCGASKNKPFCDGSHVVAGFSDD